MSHIPQLRGSGPGTINWYGETQAITKLMREKQSLVEEVAGLRVVIEEQECGLAASEEELTELRQQLAIAQARIAELQSLLEARP